VRDVVATLVRHAADGKPVALAGALAPPKVRTAISLTSEQLDRCVGRYELAPNYVLTITREGERLLGELPGQGISELFAESQSEFFLKTADMQFTFDIAEPGPARAVTGHQGGHDVLAKRLE
jgi:D-alanyl-D-alanine-carboxypeptidase/D-alanyl-D-alanine-endopeptidase